MMSEVDGNGEKENLGPEPSVWDWIVSLLHFKPIPIPEVGAYSKEEKEPVQVEETETPPEVIQEVEEQPTHLGQAIISVALSGKIYFPLAVTLALFAQFTLEQKTEKLFLPVISYFLSFLLIALTVLRGDFHFPRSAKVKMPPIEPGVRLIYLIPAGILAFATYLLTRENTFNLLNLLTWGGSLAAFLLAFWQGETPFQRLRNWVTNKQQEGVRFRLGAFELLFVASIVLIIFYRVHHLDSVPLDMWSDQAEKLLDVLDVLEGKLSIYFPRNTGREGLQMYLAASTAAIFQTGISFMTLKIGTVAVGLATLPFVYLFAREYGGRTTGLLAMFLCGIAHWPNILSRLGLRFPLYPLFVAPSLYFLLRGLRTKQRNDFLLLGVAVGLGLHGYSPARVIPIAVTLGVLIYIVHSIDSEERRRLFSWLALTGVIAFVIFLPLLSTLLESPDVFLYRMMTRVGTAERDYPEPLLRTIRNNLWNALRMFSWDNGELWVVSVPHRPALDWVSGGFFHLGVVVVLARYIRRRDWKDLFLLLAIPILLLPSILSLAFPAENPAPNRASGAIVPVFTMAAISLALVPSWIERAWGGQRKWLITTAVLTPLLVISLFENYRLVFDEYDTQHRAKTWNTREVGEYIKGFATTVGDYDTAHVVAIPHWLDGRLVAMIAGANPRIDYSIWPENFRALEDEERPQLFVIKPEDLSSIETLQEIFPTGTLTRIESDVFGHDFMIYFVPSEGVEEYPTEGIVQ